MFFPPSDVPGIQSSILCFYHNLVDHCVHLHQSRGKNGKAQTVLHGVAFYAEYLEIMLIIASHILLARAQNPTCHSPSAEEKKEKRKKKKRLGNTVGQVVQENDEIMLVSCYGSCCHSMNFVSQLPVRGDVGEEK